MAKRRKRKKNPTKNRSGLGAFLGSVLGAAPGAAFKSYPWMAVGSMLGGGVGGYLGAKTDRQTRGAVGGAVGGALLGPLGAAAGGYVGGLKPDSRRSNTRKSNPKPATVALALGAGIAAVGVGYVAYKGMRRLRVKKALGPADALQSVLGNEALSGSPEMVADIQQPILLQVPAQPLPVDDEFDRVPEIRILVPKNDEENEILTPAGAAFGVDGDVGTSDTTIALVDESGDIALRNLEDKAIGHLITGLSPEAQSTAYDLAIVHIGVNHVDWKDPEKMDATIQQILTTVAPQIDWTERLRPHTYGSAAWQAWVGVQLVGTIAFQSLVNKLQLAQG